MVIFALMGKGLGFDGEDGWSIVSLHKTRTGAEAARGAHAADLRDEDSDETLTEYLDNYYDIEEHELVE